MVKVELTKRSLIISWIIAIGIIIFALFSFGIVGASRDEERNFDLNMWVERCEGESMFSAGNHPSVSYESCVRALQIEQGHACAENSAYDICNNGKIEQLARERLD